MLQPAEHRPLPRGLAFLVLSLGLHASAAGVLAAWDTTLSIPRPDIVWLDLDNRLGAPRARAPEPPPEPKPAAPEPASPSTEAPKKLAARRAAPDAGVPRDAGTAPRDVGATGDGRPYAGPQIAELAPGDAALMLLLRMDRIQGSPYAGTVRRLLEVFYDHKTLLWSSGLDPVADFRALLIATPNPYRVTRTFLAVSHDLPRPRIRAAVERATRFESKRIRWSTSGDFEQGEIPTPPKLASDPRVVLLREGLVMLADPSHIPFLASAADAPGSALDAGPEGGSWLQRLRQMPETGGAAAGGPAMVLEAVNLPRLVRLPPDVPLPLSLTVTVPATDPATATGRLVFTSPAQARRFMVVIPPRIAQARRSLVLRLLGVTDLLDALKLRAEGERVHVSVELNADAVQALLEMVRGMIPQVHVPGMPPRLPPDAGPDSAPPNPAAGPGDAGRPSAPDLQPRLRLPVWR